jgi:dTMP kinase
MMGLFIVFEGGEGAGKSTQALLLAEALRDADHDVLLTAEPGATGIGAAIRDILLDDWSGGMPAKTEALLFLADRAAHVEHVVRPALARGQTVISDRYVDSTIVYQGHGRGIDVGLVLLSNWATDELNPDLVLVLDIDPRVGLTRAGRAGALDRIERERLAFHERVRAGFLERAELGERRRARRDGAVARYVVIDADRPADKVAADVLAAVTEHLARV